MACRDRRPRTRDGNAADARASLADLRVTALRWWPLTFGGTASVSPLGFGVVYVSPVVLLGGLSTVGVTQGRAGFGTNALGGFIGAPAIENVALGCANIGIGPA